MIVPLGIIVFGGLSAIINALLGSKYGIKYGDMVLVGIFLTPLLPLYICIQAALIDGQR